MSRTQFAGGAAIDRHERARAIAPEIRNPAIRCLARSQQKSATDMAPLTHRPAIWPNEPNAVPPVDAILAKRTQGCRHRWTTFWQNEPNQTQDFDRTNRTKPKAAQQRRTSFWPNDLVKQFQDSNHMWRHSGARPKAESPESITTGRGYGFRARRFAAPRNDGAVGRAMFHGIDGLGTLR
jgi:hypothetical protein